MHASQPAHLIGVLVGLCAVAVCLAGCLTADMYTTVDADGTISHYRLEVTTSQDNYVLLEESAHQEGYATVRAMIEERGLLPGADTAPVAYDEQWIGGEVFMTFSAQSDLSADQLAGVQVAREGEHLVYRHVIGDGRSGSKIGGEDPFASGTATAFVVNYYLVMPGAIVDSNADAVEGATAEWHLSGADMLGTVLFAKSAAPARGVPGFSCWIAIAAVCILCCGVARAGQVRRRG
ncbi:MAG: hypothetical protein QCH35_09905 [Methanomicrobiaceae archaeon]|nr:hypothetical protein [Methanomicrobiaceae archaeon]